MTDNEIKKALECCKNADCQNCPRWSEEWFNGMCNDFLSDVLDLINRLQAENERLIAQNGFYETCNARKQERIDFLEIYLKTAKSEARKELAEKIKAKNGNNFLEEWYESADICYEFNQEEFEAYIDNLLEEMESEDE